MAKLIGYQIADAKGNNIQGDGICPFDFPSFEVLAPAAAHTLMTKLAEEGIQDKFLLQPICEGDVEECEIVEAIDYLAS